MTVLHRLRRGFRRLGVDVSRFDAATTEFGRLARMLAHREVSVVLDVGANTGQYADELRRSGFQRRIISFEPLTVAHEALSRRAMGDALWTVAPRCAIGEVPGTASINIARNSVSSSLLPIHATHVRAAPQSATLASELVTVLTLDDVASELVLPADRVFVKLDVQGFERQVISGGPITLGRAVGIQLELSFTRLYEGQPADGGWMTLLEQLMAMGFEPWGIFPGFCDPASGRTLQMDALMFRNSSAG